MPYISFSDTEVPLGCWDTCLNCLQLPLERLHSSLIILTVMNSVLLLFMASPRLDNFRWDTIITLRLAFLCMWEFHPSKRISINIGWRVNLPYKNVGNRDSRWLFKGHREVFLPVFSHSAELAPSTSPHQDLVLSVISLIKSQLSLFEQQSAISSFRTSSLTLEQNLYLL